MPKLNGRFFFQKTDNGNLIGEFSNNLDPNISTESADCKKGCENKECVDCKWHGTYHTSWQEECDALFAELKIFHKKGSAKLFSLAWCRNNIPPNNIPPIQKNLIFVGEGMLCNGMLIGDYRPPNDAEKSAHLRANPQPITCP